MCQYHQHKRGRDPCCCIEHWVIRLELFFQWQILYILSNYTAWIVYFVIVDQVCVTWCRVLRKRCIIVEKCMVRLRVQQWWRTDSQSWLLQSLKKKKKLRKVCIQAILHVLVLSLHFFGQFWCHWVVLFWLLFPPLSPCFMVHWW